MGISRDSRHKRSATGAKRAYYRKKRAFEKGRQPANTRIGGKRIHLVRTRGGNRKFRALRLDSGNFSWGSEGISRKVRVIAVAFHPSNNELVRTNTLTKAAVVQVDAAPFRQWYEAHYGQALGRRRQKKEGAEAEEVKKSKSVEKKQAERMKEAGKVEAPLERQFEAGRLYAVVASRPGQSGRVDGMFRWLVPQRTTEKIAESFINVYPRQQRAQAFYQRHQRFGTRSSLRQEATARSGDEYEAPSDLSLPPAAAHDDPSGTATALAPVKRSFRASGSPRSAASKATPASALVPKSRIESRIERKSRRMTAGTYKPAASAMDKQQEEEERIQTVLAKLDDMEEPARPNLGDAIPQTPKTVKKSKVETRSNTKPGVRDSGREKRLQPKPKRDPWELQKDALEHKFGETGWQPRKRLSPDTLDGIRALHASDPGAYSTETLSDHFKIAPEAIRRILKSKGGPMKAKRMTDERGGSAGA
ncbi:ribosomal protein S8A [Friedmanniomyces endolithicus]|nr:ribosomal protein S8A [Friedmanniomyces endolithicus]